jgi:hypothetical protein
MIKSLICRYAAATILIIVALLQHFRALAYDQSSWIGCGFGMFATLDNHRTRFFRWHLPEGASSGAGDFERRYPQLAHDAKVIPTSFHVGRLGRAAAHELAADRSDRPRHANPTPTEGLRIELWKVQLDFRASRLRAHPSVRVEQFSWDDSKT